MSANDWNQKIIDEFRANKGQVGGMFEGAPMILIHHVGAKSGTTRVTPLVHFPEEDGRTVIVASAGGAPSHPSWYHNITANPEFEVEIGDETSTVRSEEIPSGPEYDAVWQRVVTERPGFAEYKEKTSRVIPLLRLTRVG
ncbi:nitroreductase/quinone reductase family protein [Actinomycetes bacterium KLBMP 9759]